MYEGIWPLAAAAAVAAVAAVAVAAAGELRATVAPCAGDAASCARTDFTRHGSLSTGV